MVEPLPTNVVHPQFPMRHIAKIPGVRVRSSTPPDGKTMFLTAPAKAPHPPLPSPPRLRKFDAALTHHRLPFRTRGDGKSTPENRKTAGENHALKPLKNPAESCLGMLTRLHSRCRRASASTISTRSILAVASAALKWPAIARGYVSLAVVWHGGGRSPCRRLHSDLPEHSNPANRQITLGEWTRLKAPLARLIDLPKEVNDRAGVPNVEPAPQFAKRAVLFATDVARTPPAAWILRPANKL